MEEKFITHVKQVYGYEVGERIIDAYTFAKRAHSGATRASGEPYIIHPVKTAEILVDLNLDEATIIAALLHDVVEDTDVTFKEINDKFGQDVEELVRGVTKISLIKYSKDVAEMENLRRLFISMSKDVRVIMIKLADRIHNMRTLTYLPHNRQIKFASETMDLFVPLAERLGLNSMKAELEDLCFMYLNPIEYNKLKNELDRKYQKTTTKMADIKKRLNGILSEEKITGEVSGRFKHFYSIYKKLRSHGTAKIYDIIAFRMIVPTISDCYTLLGAVHSQYRPIPGRIKDYIASPKLNGYQSLHTTVITDDGTPFEVQIRTYDMHIHCEYGIASHWRYKSGNTKEDMLEDKFNWLKSIINEEREIKDSGNFVKALRMDFSTSEIWVFTPKYKPISLPEGSTPIDMAYAIHSDLGNMCIGAKVNDKSAPLNKILETGDVVEILVSNDAKGPSRDWLTIAASTAARRSIRAFFRKNMTPENIIKGQKILAKEAAKAGLDLINIQDKCYENLQLKYNFENLDDMFACVGYGSLTPNQILKKYITEHNEELYKEKNKDDYIVSIDDVKIHDVKFARCCTPILGDEIVGVYSQNNGYTIHRSDCPNMKFIEDDKKKTAVWNENNAKDFYVSLKLGGRDENGLTAKLLNILYSNENIDLEEIKSRKLTATKFEVTLRLKIKNREDLERLIKLIQAEPYIDYVTRNNLN